MAASSEKGVQVMVRVRPMLTRELQFNHAVEVLSVSAAKCTAAAYCCCVLWLCTFVVSATTCTAMVY